MFKTPVAEHAPQAYFTVKSGAFDGPLDLLLHLIEKNEVDIFDIPIAPITEQYLRYMKTLDGLDMDALSGFLLMAATLLSIKTRLLMPKQAPEQEDEEDPRSELVNRLIDYKQFKERAEEFAEREKLGILAAYKEKDATINWDFSANTGTEPIVGVVSPARLRKIFEELLARRERRTDKIRGSFGAITLERFTITDRMAFISDKLRLAGRMSFFELFDASSGRDEMITTFLALLELIKQRKAAVVQDGLFEDIEITSG